MSDERAEVLRWRIGEVTVTRVVESITPVPAGYLLTGLTADHVRAQRPWIDPYFDDDEHLLLSVHSFVVESRGTTVVVDTCAGVHEGRRLDGDPAFLDRLDGAVDGGVASIDVVVCTHLHFDHVGWNTVRDDSGHWVPAFPNARFLMTSAELDHFADRDEDGVAASSLDPLAAAGVLDAVAPDHRITPEVRLLPTPGHTRGHVSVLIRSGEASGLITGDAFHSPIQIAYPELAAGRVDHDSDESTRTRRELLERFTDGDTLILGTHFASPTAGRLVTVDGTVRLSAHG